MSRPCWEKSGDIGHVPLAVNSADNTDNSDEATRAREPGDMDVVSEFALSHHRVTRPRICPASGLHRGK